MEELVPWVSEILDVNDSYYWNLELEDFDSDPLIEEDPSFSNLERRTEELNNEVEEI
jgi:hypothetical protein